jgi:2-oxoglutarate ferredoxin oxidoreductase subunit alpha
MSLGFDLADKYRNPVIVLSDGMLGQMMEPIKIKNKKSKIKNYKKPWALTGCKGRKPNVIKSFYMAEGDLEKFNLKLQKKYRKISQKEQLYEDWFLDDARIILVAYGTMARIAKAAVHKLREKGKKIGLIRPIALWPFPQDLFKRLTRSGRRVKFFVVEMSYGQMVEDVKLAVNGKSPVEFLGRAGGGIPTEGEIIRKVGLLKLDKP